jgi:hypothetical protein
MVKFIVVFVIGMSVGYAYGYQQGETGQPSVVQKIVGSVGGSAYKVKADQERRERTADSVSAPIRR